MKCFMECHYIEEMYPHNNLLKLDLEVNKEKNIISHFLILFQEEHRLDKAYTCQHLKMRHLFLK